MDRTDLVSNSKMENGGKILIILVLFIIVAFVVFRMYKSKNNKKENYGNVADNIDPTLHPYSRDVSFRPHYNGTTILDDKSFQLRDHIDSQNEEMYKRAIGYNQQDTCTDPMRVDNNMDGVPDFPVSYPIDYSMNYKRNYDPEYKIDADYELKNRMDYYMKEKRENIEDAINKHNLNQKHCNCGPKKSNIRNVDVKTSHSKTCINRDRVLDSNNISGYCTSAELLNDKMVVDSDNIYQSLDMDDKEYYHNNLIRPKMNTFNEIETDAGMYDQNEGKGNQDIECLEELTAVIDEYRDKSIDTISGGNDANRYFCKYRNMYDKVHY